MEKNIPMNFNGKVFLCSTPNQEHLQIKKNMWTMDIIYIIIKKYFESNDLLYIKQIQLSVFVLVKRGTESLWMKKDVREYFLVK